MVLIVSGKWCVCMLVCVNYVNFQVIVSVSFGIRMVFRSMRDPFAVIRAAIMQTTQLYCCCFCSCSVRYSCPLISMGFRVE